MKKLITAILSLSFLICTFTGCEKSEEKTPNENNPTAVQDIPENAVSDFAYKETDEEVTIIGYKGASTTVKIPSEINGKPVRTIAEYAFDGFEKTEEGSYQTHKENNITRIVSLFIPDSVKVLEEGAFANCYSLTEAVLSEGVEVLGEGAFANCEKLVSISIPDSVTDVGSFVFNRCTSLEAITFGKNVKTIGQYAFYECTALKDVTLPDGIESLGKGTFFSCTALEELTIPAGIKTIEEYAFGYTMPVDEHGNATGSVFELIDDVTIKSASGSEAEKYAQTNDIKFKSE